MGGKEKGRTPFPRGSVQDGGHDIAPHLLLLRALRRLVFAALLLLLLLAGCRGAALGGLVNGVHWNQVGAKR
jgi:hypothetical protein